MCVCNVLVVSLHVCAFVCACECRVVGDRVFVLGGAAGAGHIHQQNVRGVLHLFGPAEGCKPNTRVRYAVRRKKLGAWRAILS